MLVKKNNCFSAVEGVYTRSTSLQAFEGELLLDIVKHLNYADYNQRNNNDDAPPLN